jgi:TatD DNase family protein
MSENILNVAELECKGLFDSHAHYFDKRFEFETEGADKILTAEVFGRGIDGVINVGTNNDNNRRCIDQAAKYQKMYVAVGIHPEDVAYCKKSIDEELDELCALFETREIQRQNKIVAIGEIGLDYHYEGFDKELQQTYFERQLEIAKQYGLPVVIHDRDAHGDCFETVLRYPDVKGVFHSFSGSREMATELVRRGWYISFSGVLTFKNARKCVEVAESVPLDRILIETDCPYLAPHPHRGKINHSGLMCLTAKRLAEIKGMDYSEVVSIVRENTRDLFGV